MANHTFRHTLLALFAAAPLGGASSGADFLLIEPTARAAAVGGAYSAHRGEPEGLRYNPAALAGLKGAAASMAHVSAPGDWSHEWAGGGFQAGAYALGAEILVSSIKPFELYDTDGAVTDMAQAGSQNLMLAASRGLPGGWLSAGLGLRYFRSQLYSYSSQGIAADLGLQAGRNGGPLRFGLAVQNLGAQAAYIADADPLPLCVRAGGEARLVLDAHTLLQPRVDVLAFADASRPVEIRAGLEAVLVDRVSLRAGLQRAGSYQQLSFGTGVNWNGWGLDYAFLPGSELGPSHLIELHVSSGL